MNRTLLFLIVTAIGVGLLGGMSACAQGGPRTIIVSVNDHPRPWGESQIEKLLIRSLSMSSNLRAFSIDSNHDLMPPLPQDWYDADSLANWAMERGCRYVLAIDILDERLERRKGFHLPLVFHKYQTVGIIEADIRLFDAGRGKFLMTELLKVEENGPRVFQATMDDDINDPDLHLTTPGKLSFMARLEQKFCRHLIKKLGKEILLR